MENNQLVADYKKNRGLILLIAVAGMTAYLLPYLRSYYYDDMIQFFGITDLQMGTLGSVYGAFAIIGYCLGGWVADRFPLKYIVPGSLIVTGLLGYINMLRPSYGVLLFINGAWGITTILTFWNPLMKALRFLSKPEEQGRGYALFDIGRGVLNFVFGVAVVAGFAAVVTKVGNIGGVNILFAFYSTWTVVVGVVVYFLIRKIPDIRPKNKEKDKAFAKNLLDVIKMPTTWCLIIAMFANYGVIVSFFYLVPYCTAVFGLSAAVASILGYCGQAFRIAGCAIGGNLADRKGLSNMYIVDMALMALGYLAIILLPEGFRAVGVLIILIGIIAMSQYAAQALHYAVMEEGDYPVEKMGAATFIITPLGYAGESIFPLFNGWCLSHWSDSTTAYNFMFGGYVVVLIIGIIAVLIFQRFTKERRAMLAEQRKARLAKADAE